MTHAYATAAAVASLSLCSAAQAHHTAAMFDQTRTVVISGTVRDFQWTSPHSWIQLVVAQPQGPAEWSIEMAAPVELIRLGWKKTSLQPGDKAVLTVHPLRDGGKGGQFVSGAGANGAPIGVVR